MIKLASEKSFNLAICPVINIKGKTVTYPFVIKHKTFGFGCMDGILGPKNMMIMDIIATMLFIIRMATKVFLTEFLPLRILGLKKNLLIVCLTRFKTCYQKYCSL